MATDRPSWQNREDEESDDEKDVDENAYVSAKDAVLFAIEISESMTTVLPCQNGKAKPDSPVSAALKCAYRIMQDRIISNPKDMMGILLFGTEKTKFQGEDEKTRGGPSFPHCYLLADLDIPDAATVKRIKRLIGDEDRTEANALLEPSSEPVAMASMLFCSNQTFTTKAPNFGSRRLFIVTDDDNPHGNDKTLRETATVRAKDLYDLGVIIELFPISKAGDEFDRSLFYDDLLYVDPNPDDISVPSATLNPLLQNDGLTLLTALISSVKSKQTPKRALFSNLTFEIGSGLTISVKGYNVIDRQKKARTSYIWEAGEKSQIVHGQSTLQAEDTARTITDKAEVKSVYKFAGTQVELDKETEQPLVNYFGDRKWVGKPPSDLKKSGLRIIGFKPQKMLPVWASMKKSTFIYPSEDDFVGSTRVFAALHQKLLKDELMGVAWAVVRENASPVVVAILPSTEVLANSGQQIASAGLWLYTLPFADDLRPLPSLPTPIIADESLIEQISKTIRQLQLPGARYDPTQYANPALQWHYRIIQAMALDEELPDQAIDKTVPKFRIDKRAASFLAEWNILLEEKYLLHQQNLDRSTPETSSRKRSFGPSTGPANKKAKKPKVENDDPKCSVEDMRALYQQNKVKTCTAQDLKDFLKAQGLDAKGLKAKLVDTVEEFFEDKMGR